MTLCCMFVDNTVIFGIEIPPQSQSLAPVLALQWVEIDFAGKVVGHSHLL